MSNFTQQAIQEITQRIIARSAAPRAAYLARMQEQAEQHPPTKGFSCGNLAHTVAAVRKDDKQNILKNEGPNIAIVSAYNDMLSAHKPYEDYPPKIRELCRQLGGSAQVAGMVPAMCDGVTQGQIGMRLSLFSRDLIAMATAVSLSHNAYQGIMCLGICDKIVPGLVIGALQFGHLPVMFLPAGPMSTGQSNKDKARVRQAYARGDAQYDDLLESECKSYHGQGTCTFYGTANSNQMLLELMGLQLPSSSFVHPYGIERESFNAKAVRQLMASANEGRENTMAEIVTEKSIVNAMVGLLATGGSTNHTIHLVAMAKAAGIIIDWQDLSDISDHVPLLCRIYPNGAADVNAFHDAGGMAYVMRQLVDGGLLNMDVKTVLGDGLAPYLCQPELVTDEILTTAKGWASSPDIIWQKPATDCADAEIISTIDKPFHEKGGLMLLKGNLGRSIIKISAVKEAHQVVTAPAKVFSRQSDFMDAYKAGELDEDFIAVLRFQGPKTVGMPELHQLTPILGNLLDAGRKVALITDGRMSGASGKVPAAIHLVPEAADAGPIARIKNGDIIHLDAVNGILEVQVNDTEFAQRTVAVHDDNQTNVLGTELFKTFRASCSNAEQGATVF